MKIKYTLFENWFKRKMDYIKLGKTELTVSKVGFGVLPIGPGQLALPIERGADVLCYAIKSGINFIDTAQYYRAYPYIKTALAKLEREGYRTDNLVICSKCLSADYDEMTAAIAEAYEMMGRPADIFLMHEVRPGQFEERKAAWQALIDAKANGLVKAIGISTHHADIAESMAKVSECDVVFPLYNYAGMGIRYGNRQGTVEEMYYAIKCLSEAKIGVFTMKVFGGGNLTDNYQKALDFVYSCPEIESVMVGFGCEHDIDDMVNYLSGKMPKDYNPDTSKKLVRINYEDCEGCGTCIPTCASKAISFGSNGLAVIDQSKCITCGYCALACPVRAIIRY